MAKVKYVLVGFGGIAENRVAKEGYACDKKRFKPLKTAQLVGATDMNPARKAAAEALGLKWYASLDEVLADKSVDGVYIATNNASHAALALAALKAGKHVIVEKPAATSVADAKKMEALAKKKGLSLTVDHMMVNNAWNIAAAKAVQSGKLGKRLLQVVIHFQRALAGHGGLQGMQSGEGLHAGNLFVDDGIVLHRA